MVLAVFLYENKVSSCSLCTCVIKLHSFSFIFLQLRQVFGLYGQTTGKGKVPRSELHARPLELFMCSVLKRQGYGEGFRWIAQYLD